MKEKKEEEEEKETNKQSGNFGTNFLRDFQLGGFVRTDSEYIHKWNYLKKALDRFHEPGIRSSPNGIEGKKHFKLKTLTHDYIYENYYLENECKFLVTTELEQKKNPFFSYMDGKIPVFFTLDVCVIRESDKQVFDIEIDGPEHYTKKGMMKADIRDEWLKDRYGVLTYRIDANDNEPNYIEIDKFISQPAVENPRKLNKNY